LYEFCIVTHHLVPLSITSLYVKVIKTSNSHNPTNPKKLLARTHSIRYNTYKGSTKKLTKDLHKKQKELQSPLSVDAPNGECRDEEHIIYTHRKPVIAAETV